MRIISLGQALELHRRIIEQSGGTPGILNLGALESALLQPLCLWFLSFSIFPAPLSALQSHHPSIPRNYGGNLDFSNHFRTAD